MNETQNLLTVDMAAEYLHCHPETVRRMIRRGELKAVKFRKFWRVPMEGLLRAEKAALAEPVSTQSVEDATNKDNPLARALAMVLERDAALTKEEKNVIKTNAADDINAMREERLAQLTHE